MHNWTFPELKTLSHLNKYLGWTVSGESLFLRKLVLRTSCPNKRQKLNATANAFGCPSRPATLVPYPTRAMEHHCAMTRRDFGWPCNFTTQTTLREIAQPLSLLGTKNLHSAIATFPRFSTIVLLGNIGAWRLVKIYREARRLYKFVFMFSI